MIKVVRACRLALTFHFENNSDSVTYAEGVQPRAQICVLARRTQERQMELHYEVFLDDLLCVVGWQGNRFICFW